MNNLHRELAPISSAAWAQIEEEVARTFRRNLAGRRVVDVIQPESGAQCPAVGTGHLAALKSPQEGVIARQRQVMPMIELRVPFELSREAIDDVERGSQDSDWQPAKDAAEQLAYAEDRAIFLGYKAAGITGISEGSSNPVLALPAQAAQFPDTTAAALKQLKLAGVDGPYTAVLGADTYTALQEANAWWAAWTTSCGRPPSKAPIWFPRAGATSPCTWRAMSPSATSATPKAPCACIWKKSSPSSCSPPKPPWRRSRSKDGRPARPRSKAALSEPVLDLADQAPGWGRLSEASKTEANSGGKKRLSRSLHQKTIPQSG